MAAGGEKLISAVANHPELYDATYYFYRDRNKKDLAWRQISEEIGRRWKSLRDTYNKEKRAEKEKRSGLLISLWCFVLCFTGPQRRTTRRRAREGSQDGPSAVELAILECLKRPRPSATEYFLLSLVPALEIFENSTAVLNLETLDPNDQ
uniref:MADF domain-containing protein n=1 Tax=Astatotilapia calliptera TaxID=8154 RepID=A0A3P8PEP9_ASTCA